MRSAKVGQGLLGWGRPKRCNDGKRTRMKLTFSCSSIFRFRDLDRQTKKIIMTKLCRERRGARYQYLYTSLVRDSNTNSTNTDSPYDSGDNRTAVRAFGAHRCRRTGGRIQRIDRGSRSKHSRTKISSPSGTHGDLGDDFASKRSKGGEERSRGG